MSDPRPDTQAGRPAALSPYPARGDVEGWSRWWETYRQVGQGANLAAGIRDGGREPTLEQLRRLPPPRLEAYLRQLGPNWKASLRRQLELPDELPDDLRATLIYDMQANPDAWRPAVLSVLATTSREDLRRTLGLDTEGGCN